MLSGYRTIFLLEKTEKPRAKRRGASICGFLSGRRLGLQGVEQVTGLGDGVFFEELPEDVGEDAAVEVAVYFWLSDSGGALWASFRRF